MLCHSLGGAVILFPLQHFIDPASDLLPCLEAKGPKDCNKGSKFKNGAMKCDKESVLVNFSGKNTFQKLWP